MIFGYGKKKKKSSVSASLAATEGCGRCPARLDEENDNIPYIINTDNDNLIDD